MDSSPGSWGTMVIHPEDSRAGLRERQRYIQNHQGLARELWRP